MTAIPTPAYTFTEANPDKGTKTTDDNFTRIMRNDTEFTEANPDKGTKTRTRRY